MAERRRTPTEEALAAVRGRTRLVQQTQAELRAYLATAERQILQILAAAPSDYQAWMLPQLLAEIRRVLQGVGTEAAGAVDVQQVAAWRAGSAVVDRSLAAAGISAALPQIAPTQLQAMRAFLTEKIRDITLDAANAINGQLGLVTIGAQTPFDAVRAVSKTLGETTLRRGATIVNTELNRAFNTASQLRMEQHAELNPDIRKRWVQSGKREPRPEHVAIDGQEVPVGEPFVLEGGAVTLMHPGDPAGPARHTINCGCLAITVVPRFKSMVQDRAKDREAERARGRAALQAALRGS